MTRLLLLVCLLLCINYPAPAIFFQQKTITIEVDEKEQVFIDRVKIETDDLAKELQQRLWRSFVSNGKMPQEIQLKFNAAITAGKKKDITDAVKQAQEKTLTVLSLHKYKNKFENIGARKQEKLKKQFPVLFRQDYLSS